MQRSRITILLLMLLLIAGRREQLYAQYGNTAYKDSLEQCLHKKLTDAGRADLLFRLSKYWADADTAKALQYLQQALQYNPRDAYSRAKAYYYEANIYLNYDIAKAQALYLQSDNLLKNINTTDARSLLARVWNNYAVGSQMEGDNKTFISIITGKVIPIRTGLKDTGMLGVDYLNIGGAMSNSLNYEKAVAYYKQAIVYLKQGNPYNEDLIEAYSSVAGNYLYQYKSEAAKLYIDSAASVLARHPQSFLSPVYYRIAATYYNRLGSWDTAQRLLVKGIAAARALYQPYYQLQLRFELSKTLMGQRAFEAARKELLSIYADTAAMMRIENKRMVLMGLAQADSALLHTGAAYRWLLQYTFLSDSVATTDHRIGVERVELKFQTAEKEKRILALENERQRSRFLTITLSVIALSSLLLLLAGWRFYKSRQKIAGQERQLQLQIVKELQQSARLDAYKAMLEGQEQERSRLARDLHDGLGGALAGVKLRLSAITGHRKDTTFHTDQELQQVIGPLDQSVTELRRIAHNLMPQVLTELGLEPALRNLCHTFTNEELQVDTAFLGLEQPIPQPVQTAVYRIVQELLNNARKHARATAILVQCTRNNGHIFITVEDDGTGIDSHSRESGGIGLMNIRKRVDYLKGTFDIHSAPGQGTTVNIEISANG